MIVRITTTSATPDITPAPNATDNDLIHKAKESHSASVGYQSFFPPFLCIARNEKPRGLYFIY